MDKKFTNWLVTELKCSLAPLDFLLLIGTTVAGILLRSTVFNAVLENASYQNESQTLKLVTTVFDVLAAVMIAIFVLHMTNHRIKAMLAYGIGVMLPVMAAGSAMWGFGDSIYVFFTLLGLYFCLFYQKSEKANSFFMLGLICYAMALFLNTNALFVLPIFILAYFSRKQNGNTILGFFIAAIGLLFHMLLNNGAKSLFVLFAEEGLLKEKRPELLLSYNFPNIYQLIGTKAYIHEYGVAGRYFVIALAAVIIVLFIYKLKEIKQETILLMALIFSIFIPYFLPFMDERAGLLSAIISVIYGFVCIRNFFIPIIQVTITYLAYAAYFRGESYLSMPAIAFVQLFVLIYLIICFYFDIAKENQIYNDKRKDRIHETTGKASLH